jgi:hypothetical protein
MKFSVTGYITDKDSDGRATGLQVTGVSLDMTYHRSHSSKNA